VGGGTRGWGLHQLTEARARDLGLDLVRWPVDEPPAGWEQDAACAGVDSEVADELSECLSQLAATKSVSRWCSVCPVIRQCFETGRTTGGHGVWGSIVLRDGRVAPWQTATERVRRAKETAPTDGTVMAEMTEPTEITEQLAAASAAPRRQRRQPRKRTRSQRRSRRESRIR